MLIIFGAIAVVIFGFLNKINNEVQNLSSKTIETNEYKNCISQFSTEFCKMFIPSERVKLYDICSKAKIPKTELDTGVYPKNKIARVSWWDSERQQNITMWLPYEPETEFVDCSESAKKILRDIQTNQIKQ